MLLPSTTLILKDATDRPFGVLRLAPEDGESCGDCIFDTAPTTPAQAGRMEVRWLHKRSEKRFGEHRFRFEDGVLTVTLADFKVTFAPVEGGLKSQPPLPVIRAEWGPPPST